MSFNDFFKRGAVKVRSTVKWSASTVRNTAQRGAATVRSVSARCSANNKRMKARIAEEKRRFKNAARLHSAYKPSSSLLSNVNYLDARNYGNRKRK